MISIIVQQPPADFQGPDIVDPLIATEAMARSRGRIEIARNHHNRRRISGACALQPYMRPGSVVLYTDRHGVQHRALLVAAAITIDRTGSDSGDGFAATTSIILEYRTERGR